MIALLAAVEVSDKVFDRTPHSEDEFTYLFQAKTIAAGRLIADAPPAPEFFPQPFVMVRSGRWFGKYPPGFPTVLALGVRVGQPWLVGPLLAAASVALVYVIGQKTYGWPTGLLAAALTAVSPFLWLQAGSLLSHTTGLFWTLLFQLLLITSRARGSKMLALGAGFCLGALVLTRPGTAAAIGAAHAIWAAVYHLRRPGVLPGNLVVAGGTLCGVSALLAYNAQITGDPGVSPYELWWPFDRFGFGPGSGPTGNHTLEQGLWNTRFNLGALKSYLFGWQDELSLVPAALASLMLSARLIARATSGLAFAQLRLGPAASEAKPPARPSMDGWDLLQVMVPVSLVITHVAWWYGDQMYGPRLYFEALGALALLSARAALQCAALVSGLPRLAGLRARPARVLATGAILLLLGTLSFRGLNEFVPREFGRYVRWYGIDGSRVRQLQGAALKDAVVFVHQLTWVDYAPFFVQNSPTLDSSVVYALDLGDEINLRLMALYPGRRFYRYYTDGQLIPLAPR